MPRILVVMVNVSAAICQLLRFFCPIDVPINDISQVLVSLVVIFYLPHPVLPSWVTRMPIWQDVQIIMINKVGKTIHITFKQYWQLKNRVKINFSFTNVKPVLQMFTAIINSRGSKYKEGLNSSWVFLKLHVQVLEWYCWIFLMNVLVNAALVLNYGSRKKPLLLVLAWNFGLKSVTKNKYPIHDLYIACTLT